MRIEGYGCCCVSVSQHLTFRTFFRLANDTMFLTGNEGQNVCLVLYMNVSLQRSSGFWHCTAMCIVGHFYFAENMHAQRGLRLLLCVH